MENEKLLREHYDLRGSTNPSDIARISEIEARLVVINRPLVYRESRGYRLRISEHSDLMQSGMIGLLIAIRTYNPNLGYAFSTYAWRSIRGGEGMQGVAYHEASTHIPTNKIAKLVKARKNLESLDDELSEVASALSSVSMDAKVSNEGDLTLVDVLEQDTFECADLSMIQDEIKANALKGLESLSKIERECLILVKMGREGINDDKPMSLREAGESLGISYERVRQHINKGIENLRSMKILTQS